MARLAALWKLRAQNQGGFGVACYMKNILPAFGELQRRHIRDDVVCPMCGHRDESLFHALVRCDYAKLFWRAALNSF